MIYYSCFVVVFQFGWAATQISHLALITDLTSIMLNMILIRLDWSFILDCENVRTTLTSVRYGFTVISSILVYLTTWVFFGLEDGNQSIGHEDGDKFRCESMLVTYAIIYSFRNIMIVGMCIGILTTVGFHIIVKEPSEE